MKYILCVLMPALIFSFAGCSSGGGAETVRNENFTPERVTEATKISDVINNPAFENYGRMIFPLNDYYYSGESLGDLRLTWYSYISPSRTVDVINYMLDEVSNDFHSSHFTPETKKTGRHIVLPSCMFLFDEILLFTRWLSFSARS